MGDWEGTHGGAKLCAQAIALGDGQYRANMLAKWDTRDPKLAVLNGNAADGKVAFAGKAKDGTVWTATIEGDTFAGKAGDADFTLKKTVRLSPTLGEKRPEAAIVLFDGTSLDAWQQRNGKPINWILDKDAKTMTVKGGGIISKQKFKDFRLHLEFRTPFQPKKRGQGRGNSGVYFQGRYEVQVLDSYGLEGKTNECGGIYGVAVPKVNMCAPPLQWQTYDAVFRAPRFDDNGKKVKEATITMKHNGVLIHENQAIPKLTTAHWGGAIHEPGGIHLQDHGNLVSYRNIWVIPLRED
jgi:hypothetical protein